MRPFTDVLRDHRNGKLVDRLSERLVDVVSACQDTGKSGEITLKLKIVPDKSDKETFEIIPNVTVKLPERDLPRGLFYATEDGDLLREPPRGGALFAAGEIESERGIDDRHDREPPRTRTASPNGDR